MKGRPLTGRWGSVCHLEMMWRRPWPRRPFHFCWRPRCLCCCFFSLVGAGCRAILLDAAIAGCTRAADCFVLVILPSCCFFVGSVVYVVSRSVDFSLLPGIGMSCSSRNHRLT